MFPSVSILPVTFALVSVPTLVMLGCELAAVVNVPVKKLALTKFAPVTCEPLPLSVISLLAAIVMLPESIFPVPKFKLEPVAAPIFGVTNCAESLTFTMSDAISSVVLSTFTLNVVPVKSRPSPAVY